MVHLEPCPNASLPICALDPPMRMHLEGSRAARDLGPSIFLPLIRIWDEASRLHSTRMNRVAVNYGANDGKTDDPIYPLIRERGFTGIAVEGARGQGGGGK